MRQQCGRSTVLGCRAATCRAAGVHVRAFGVVEHMAVRDGAARMGHVAPCGGSDTRSALQGCCGMMLGRTIRPCKDPSL